MVRFSISIVLYKTMFIEARADVEQAIIEASLAATEEGVLEETKKEVAWGIEFATVNLNKLKNKYYDVLEFERFTVKGIKNGAYVTTFRVKTMSDFLTARIEAFKAMLENEMIGKNQDDDDDFLDDASKDGENAVDDTK